jgi:protein TonB
MAQATAQALREDEALGPPASTGAGAPPVARARTGVVRRSRLRWPVIVSLALHSAVAAAVVRMPSQETGALQEPTDAISVELFASHVMEQAVEPIVESAAAMPAATALEDGEAVESLAAAEPVSASPVESMPVETVVAAEPAVVDSVDSVVTGEGPEAEIAAVPAREMDEPKPDTPKPDTPKPERPARKPDPEKPSVKPETRRETAANPDRGKDKDTRTKGGVAARGATDRAATGGRASASAGSMVGYAARVRARVASNKPGMAGRKGTAVVSFAVTGGGGLAYARLSRSSGVPALDQAALAAVRRSAPFPTPPAGASAGQRAFSIPFHFR